jgi:hypothetical protein
MDEEMNRNDQALLKIAVEYRQLEMAEKAASVLLEVVAKLKVYDSYNNGSGTCKSMLGKLDDCDNVAEPLKSYLPLLRAWKGGWKTLDDDISKIKRRRVELGQLMDAYSEGKNILHEKLSRSSD